MSKELEEILNQIKGQLTGDKDYDLKYLQAQIESFRGHEFGGEIAKECSRMIYDRMSEEERNEAVVDMGKDRVVDLRIDDEPEEGEAIYYSFYEFFEEVMVREFMELDKPVKRTETPHADIAMQQGLNQMMEKNYEEAKKSFEEAMKWNPVNTQIKLSYMKCLEAEGAWEEIHQLALSAISYAFRPEAVAQSFVYLGKYFEQAGKNKPAAAAYYIAISYVEEEAQAMEGLRRIGMHLKEKDIRRIAEKYGFIPGANPAILSLATGLGEQLFGQQMIDGAYYCYDIVYGLTGDEKIKELLEGIKKLNL
ncbi:MAG: hypothetical protein K6G62_01715 [Eubacterium sp.]|nr:hypothetical protein [Eubacterium sp.]